MPPSKQVGLLLSKAAQDEYVIEKLLNDAEAPLEIFGFHAQQAAEKLLKAALASRNVKYPLTHQLTQLMDLAVANGMSFPSTLEDIRLLTPFAVEFRYDAIPEENEEPLDVQTT